ncbi:MAG TPA: 3-hydroxyacyl-CoA dehydrogenase NAD-binding domain-containing protein [Puia sp.]|nr:3-hydroxyacyl-CoA dehydrogenase NAD-binding domain-containing protein [Puia sp.]
MQVKRQTIVRPASGNEGDHSRQCAMRVTVVGAGAVGLSWTGLFLANGIRVTVCDPRPDVRLAVLGGLENIKWSLENLGYCIEKFTRHLYFEDKLHKAVADADIIQESIPEDAETKQSLYEKLGRFARPSALILSSSASLSASVITQRMKGAGRVLIGHCFDAPHMMPLVEVVPGKKTSRDCINRAMAFYRGIDKWPVLIGKEVSGFVVNRLHFALLRESIYLVNSGVISIEGLDQLVKASLGPRWTAAGPFKTLALGGGVEGIAHFLEHSGQMMENVWRGLGRVDLDDQTRASLRRQSDDCYARVPVDDLIKERDEEQIAILKVLRKY